MTQKDDRKMIGLCSKTIQKSDQELANFLFRHAKFTIPNDEHEFSVAVAEVPMLNVGSGVGNSLGTAHGNQDLGHQRIGYAGLQPVGTLSGVERSPGWQAGLQDHQRLYAGFLRTLFQRRNGELIRAANKRISGDDLPALKDAL